MTNCSTCGIETEWAICGTCLSQQAAIERNECDHGYPLDRPQLCAFCKNTYVGSQVSVQWERDATHLVAEWSRAGRIFTTEDLTAALGFPDGTHHPNGANNRIGRLMGRLAPLYGLKLVGRTKATNPQSNGRAIAQWQSSRPTT